MLTLFVENGLTIAALEETAGDIMEPNMLVFSEDGFPGLLKGLDMEKLGLTPEVTPNTLDCCEPLVIWEPPNGLVCGALTDVALLNGFQLVPFVEALRRGAPAALEAGAKGLKAVREVVAPTPEVLEATLVKGDIVPSVAVGREKFAVLNSFGGCIGGDANRTLLF